MGERSGFQALWGAPERTDNKLQHGQYSELIIKSAHAEVFLTTVVKCVKRESLVCMYGPDLLPLKSVMRDSVCYELRL